MILLQSFALARDRAGVVVLANKLLGVTAVMILMAYAVRLATGVLQRVRPSILRRFFVRRGNRIMTINQLFDCIYRDPGDPRAVSCRGRRHDHHGVDVDNGKGSTDRVPDDASSSFPSLSPFAP